MIERHEHHALQAVSVLAPCALLGVLFVMRTAPGSAVADAVEEPMPTIPMIPETGIDETPASAESRPGLAGKIASPFEPRGEPVPVAALLGAHAPEGPPIDAGEQEPVFTLSSILPNPRMGLAVINGNAFGIGKRVAPGWTLTAILGRERAVVLTHDSGRRIKVRMTLSDETGAPHSP